jgi:hypothetical protein
MGTFMAQTLRRTIGSRIIASLIVAFPAITTTTAGMARVWKPTPSALATDYSQIVDHRSNHEVVLVWWVVPGMAALPPQAKELLDKFVILGIVHMKVSTDGTASFSTIDTLKAADENGKQLILLQGDKVPPTVVGLLGALEAALGRALGQMGQGIHWFVFDAGDVHSCANGGLSVPFAGETYTFKTPIPGCAPA